MTADRRVSFVARAWRRASFRSTCRDKGRSNCRRAVCVASAGGGAGLLLAAATAAVGCVVSLCVCRQRGEPESCVHLLRSGWRRGTGDGPSGPLNRTAERRFRRRAASMLARQGSLSFYQCVVTVVCSLTRLAELKWMAVRRQIQAQDEDKDDFDRY